MSEALAGLSLSEKVYLVCAIVGGALFIIRIILQFIGADHGGVDVQGDVDFSGDIHADSDLGFTILSFQGITAFLMMFGLVGLFAQTGLKAGALLSIPAATAAGLAAAWLQAKLLQVMLQLQSSGTIDIKNAVGQDGTVYLTIPAGGSGKVHVTVQNRLQEFEAVSQDGQEIKTGEKIRVVFLKGDSLVVEKS